MARVGESAAGIGNSGYLDCCLERALAVSIVAGRFFPSADYRVVTVSETHSLYFVKGRRRAMSNCTGPSNPASSSGSPLR